MEFLLGGIERGEPGVFLSFEESTEALTANFASMGQDLGAHQSAGELVLDQVVIDGAEMVETDHYNLEGVFLRLGHAIDSVGARRVAIDTIGVLFSALENRAILRTEMKRLFRWLADRNVTTVITGEKGQGDLTRWGLEEYVSDCVILLDHRVEEQISRRRLRVIKYRGSGHGDNEYPFLIDETGLSVMPITSLNLQYPVSDERLSTGIEDLDRMMGGRGYYRGSSVLVSGTAGTGKSSLAAHFVDAACRRRERCLYFAFEESFQQVVRNMRSIGIDLQPYVDDGRLVFSAERPSSMGLEEHLLKAQRLIEDIRPKVVIIDPITNFLSVGRKSEVKAMLTRFMAQAKRLEATVLATSLSTGGEALESTNAEVSSLMDTWIVMRDYRSDHENKRLIYLLKSRGMSHSRKLMELLITDHGMKIQDPSFELPATARTTRTRGI
jgi:circadian clock protein KaiC